MRPDPGPGATSPSRGWGDHLLESRWLATTRHGHWDCHAGQPFVNLRGSDLIPFHPFVPSGRRLYATRPHVVSAWPGGGTLRLRTLRDAFGRLDQMHRCQRRPRDQTPPPSSPRGGGYPVTPRVRARARERKWWAFGGPGNPPSLSPRAARGGQALRGGADEDPRLGGQLARPALIPARRRGGLGSASLISR